MMTRDDELFGQQVHDAYERIELSDDAQERMLANLLAARDARQGSQAEASTDREREAEVIRLPRRHGRWALLPVAAGLVAALAVVQIGTMAFSGSSASSANSVHATRMEESAAEEEMAYEATTADGAAAKADDAAAEVDGAAVGANDTDVPMPDLYPKVTLSDGTQLSVLFEQVDEATVVQQLDQATASSTDGEQVVPCTVYELVDGGHAVRYVDDGPCWLCE